MLTTDNDEKDPTKCTAVVTRISSGGKIESLLNCWYRYRYNDTMKVQEFLEAKEKENIQKLGKLDRIIHPF